MDTTSLSLLERLRQPDQADAWARFVKLYTPLLYQWARDVCESESDRADLVQEVLLLMVQKLPEFAYDRQKSFRGWLHTVTVNKWREQRRKHTAVLPATGASMPEPPDPPPANTFEESEYRQYLVGRALQIMQQ